MQMRILAAAALLCAAPALQAYQIIEGRYKVEVSPGVFQDQLVVRCDDGHTLTVSWDTKLAQACGEGLMGERVARAAKPPHPAPLQALEAPADTAAPAPAAQPAAPPAGGLFDETAQREAMLAQIRAQFGPVPERYIEFKPGPDGLTMRMLPPLNEIVRKYEKCRRAREPGVQCGAMRDQAIAKLGEAAAPGTAAAPAKAARNAATAKPAPHADATVPAASAEPAGAAPAAATARAATEAASGQAAADAAMQKADTTQAEPARAAAAAGVQAAAPVPPKSDPMPMDRAAMEQRIAEEHVVCMRLKPRFECEQARKAALAALDKPKTAKPAKPARQVKAQPAAVPAGAVTQPPTTTTRATPGAEPAAEPATAPARKVAAAPAP
jgi:hypothetical protein